MTSIPTDSLLPVPDTADQSRRMVRLRPRLIPYFPAVVFILTTLLLPVGAINGQNNLLFWMFGLAIAALVASGVIGAWTISNISVQRDPIPTVHAGETVQITYRITNSSRVLPAFAISIAEFPRRPLAVGNARPQPTWAGRITPGVAFAEYIPRGATVTVHAEVAALRRGPYLLDTVEVWTTFPFGLSRKTIFHAREQTALIRPVSAPMRADVLASLRVSRSGVSAGATPRVGIGEEFHSLRDLVDGDSPASVAWKRSATADRLLVRQTAQPLNRRLWIGLADLRGTPAIEAERSIAAAAGLAAAAAAAGYAVGLLAAADRSPLNPRFGHRALSEIFDALALLDPDADNTIIPPADSAASRRTIIVDPALRPSSVWDSTVRSPQDLISDASILPGASEPAAPSLAARLVRILADLLPGGDDAPPTTRGTR